MIYNFGNDIKICLISDIHYSRCFNRKKFNKILLNVIKNKPDYVCILGDVIDYVEISFNERIEELYKFINDLSKISKVIVSLGNHDITNYKDKTIYPNLYTINMSQNKNIVFLDNSSYVDGKIRFIGYTQMYETYEKYDDIVSEEVSKLTSKLDNKYNILLSHNPLDITRESIFSKIKNHDKIDLILSGHTHNGMLPNFMNTNTVLISPSKKLFKKKGRGYFDILNTKVIISGGITKLSEKSGIFKYFNFVYQMNIEYINISLGKDT